MKNIEVMNLFFLVWYLRQYTGLLQIASPWLLNRKSKVKD